MKKISVPLSKKGVSDVISELRKYENSLDNKCRSVEKELALEGAELARDKVTELDAIDTGELKRSLKVQISEQGSCYYTDCKHAPFVEFGTGYVGEISEKHPLGAQIGWEHDVNNHGPLGWYYSDKDGKIRHTVGQPARPFMYESAMELRLMRKEAVRKAFKKV